MSNKKMLQMRLKVGVEMLMLKPSNKEAMMLGEMNHNNSRNNNK